MKRKVALTHTKKREEKTTKKWEWKLFGDDKNKIERREKQNIFEKKREKKWIVHSKEKERQMVVVYVCTHHYDGIREIERERRRVSVTETAR